MSTFQSVRIDQCCDIISGATPKTGQESYWGGDIFWATPKDLSELNGSAYIDSTPRTITKLGLQSCAATVLPVRSVLFSSRAPIGHVAINRVPMATNQGFKSFVPKTGVLHPEYLLHWLRANRPYLEGLGNGATFKEVSKTIVSRVEVPLPSLIEQRRIAEVLDRAEALRAKCRAALAQLDNLTHAIFLDMFGDPTANQRGFASAQLGTLVRKGDTINYGVVQPGEDFDKGIPLVRVGDLQDGRVDHSKLKRISPSIEAAYRRSRLRGDEILVSCVGSVGLVVLADESVKGFNIARAVARIPLSDAIERVFVAAYLKTGSVQRYFTNELRTVSQPTLNIKQLSETVVHLPPIELQRIFTHRITSIEALKATHRAALTELDALFASLQHRAFRGEL